MLTQTPFLTKPFLVLCLQCRGKTRSKYKTGLLPVLSARRHQLRWWTQLLLVPLYLHEGIDASWREEHFQAPVGKLECLWRWCLWWKKEKFCLFLECNTISFIYALILYWVPINIHIYVISLESQATFQTFSLYPSK